MQGDKKHPKPFWPWLKSPSVESIREIQLMRLEQQSENDKRQLRRTKIKKEPKKEWFIYNSTPGAYFESPYFRTRKEAKLAMVDLELDPTIFKTCKQKQPQKQQKEQQNDLPTTVD